MLPILFGEETHMGVLVGCLFTYFWPYSVSIWSSLHVSRHSSNLLCRSIFIKHFIFYIVLIDIVSLSTINQALCSTDISELVKFSFSKSMLKKLYSCFFIKIVMNSKNSQTIYLAENNKGTPKTPESNCELYIAPYYCKRIRKKQIWLASQIIHMLHYSKRP